MLDNDHNILHTFEDYKIDFDRTFVAIQTLYHNINTTQLIDSKLKEVSLDRISEIIFTFKIIIRKNSELIYFVKSIEDKK